MTEIIVITNSQVMFIRVILWLVKHLLHSAPVDNALMAEFYYSFLLFPFGINSLLVGYEVRFIEYPKQKRSTKQVRRDTSELFIALDGVKDGAPCSQVILSLKLNI